MNLNKKEALVLGVADNVGFGWHIAKALANEGALVSISCHPRVMSIMERFLTKDRYKQERLLKNGGEFTPKAVYPCDVSIDSHLDDAVKLSKKSETDSKEDISIAGLRKNFEKNSQHLDILVHSVAFSPEIDKSHLEVSRAGYLAAMSVSSYSLVSLCRAFEGFWGESASIMALSYIAAEKAVPFYGGAMASAKAALESDIRMLSWFLGEKGHRVNGISAGPYASRAAKSIGDIATMIENTAKKSPLQKAITADDVANCALFLASNLSKSITGEVIHVDAGFHAVTGV